MQGIEHNVGLWIEGADQGAEILCYFERVHIVAGAPQGKNDLVAGGQTDLALGGDATEQDDDMLHATASGFAAGTPTRLISQASVTPLAACTRRRTSSPRPSRSAALAPPC